ncbi:hypothetical protein HYT17_00470 [Candidatus Microgenomates bacterium]|nr:hypothetical protein [Candidatus Microgenomates bacterium]
MNSSCIRCGKERVVAKKWKEYVGTSLLTHTQTICPDVACQKLVDKELASLKEKRELQAQRRINSQNRRGSKKEVSSSAN